MPPKSKVSNPAALVLAPITLLRGSEGYFIDAATEHLKRLAQERDPDVEVIWVDASIYEPNMLQVWTSPSLFDERRHIVVDALDAANDAFLNDMIEYANTHETDSDTTIVLRHQRGTRGKRLLDLLAKKKFQIFAADPIKNEADKIAFAADKFKAAKREASPEAVRSLVMAIGNDLRELAAACTQLIADTTGRILPETVDTYYGGRVEVTGFKVADAAIAGNTALALTNLRHAFATGANPVPIVAVLASKLRSMALAAGGHAESLPPWQRQRIHRELRGWSGDGLADAIIAVAQAEAAVKGASREPEFAVERALIRIGRARGN